MQNPISRRTLLQASMAAALVLPVPRLLLADVTAYIPAVVGRPIPPDSRFGATSTAEDVTAGLDLSGITALVTGCNSGLGLETMRVLAMHGAHVIGAARTQEKAEAACASVDGRTTPLVLELTDFPGIVNASNDVRAMGQSLDMLILNAGIMALPELEQVYGLEKQFVVNHLGHFILANRLRELVVDAPQGRVVVVSSSAHKWGPSEGIAFDNLSGEAGYDPFEAYGQSKLANGLFSRELARRLANTNATSNSLHPGVIKTNLSRYLPEREESDNDDPPSFTFKSIPEGAATSCYVATSSDLDRVTGYYFSNCNPSRPNEHMQNDAMAARLWRVSEKLVAEYL